MNAARGASVDARLFPAPTPQPQQVVFRFSVCLRAETVEVIMAGTLTKFSKSFNAVLLQQRSCEYDFLNNCGGTEFWGYFMTKNCFFAIFERSLVRSKFQHVERLSLKFFRGVFGVYFIARVLFSFGANLRNFYHFIRYLTRERIFT